MPRPPRWILALCLVLGALLALSGGLGLVRALGANPVNWFTFGFEALLIVCAMFGVGCGLGRYREGPALAMLCVAGGALVSTALGYSAAHAGFGGIQRNPMAFARIAAALGFGALAALTVMSRRPHASASSAFSGVVMGALAAGAGALLALPGPRAAILGLHPVLTTLMFLTLGVLLVAFISASAHNFIRALEHGKEAPPPAPGAPGKTENA